MTIASRIGVQVRITSEMLDAARSVVPFVTVYEIERIYKAMRALEPGEPDQGVPQIPGRNPYEHGGR